MRRLAYLMPLVLVATVGTAGLADRAEAAMCAMPSERAGFDTRVLQTELMVAALTCGERSRYNSFAKKFRAELVANGKALRQYFRRVHGKRGDTETSRFVTRLANEASAQSLVNGTEAYCASASSLFSQVLGLESADLQAYVARRTFAVDHGMETCPQETTSD